MHNRKVFPLKTLLYGSSKTSTAVNTAANPADLADGAIGIYGTHKAAGVNLNKTVLLTDGGSETLGFIAAASFVGDEIVIAMGTATGAAQLSNPIQKPQAAGGPSGLQKAVAQVFTAPVLGVWRIGYNGTAGSSLNLPGTIVKGDDFGIGVNERNYIVSANRDPGNKKQFSVAAVANGDTALNLLQNWIAAINLRPFGESLLIDRTKVKIIHNGTGAVFTNSATVAAVNGATTLTTSAAHGVTAGDTIALGTSATDGDLYVTTTGTTGSTLVLTRPYQGATATIANVGTLDISGAATQWGLELVDDAAGRNLVFSVDGIAQNATKKQMTAPLIGSGTQAQVQAMEEEARPKKGSSDMLTFYAKRDPIRATGTYDLYILTLRNSNQSGAGANASVFSILNYLTLAFPSGVADTATFAQSDFEDAMTSLFTTFPAIS